MPRVSLRLAPRALLASAVLVLAISGTTTIGPLPADLDFDSVSAGTGSSGPAYGIEISGTGASAQGAVNIDGGTIESATTDGVSISGEAVVSVENMAIESSTGDGLCSSTRRRPR